MIGEHTSIWMTPSLLSYHALETWNVMNPTKGGPYLVLLVPGIFLP